MIKKYNTGNKKRAYLKENYGRNILPLSIIENACFPGYGPIEIFLYYKKETPVEKLVESLWKAAGHYNVLVGAGWLPAPPWFGRMPITAAPAFHGWAGATRCKSQWVYIGFL